MMDLGILAGLIFVAAAIRDMGVRISDAILRMKEGAK